MTDLYIVFAIWIVMLLSMIATGLSGIQYARVLNLTWTGYCQPLGWLFFGLFGFIQMASAIIDIQRDGRPPAVGLLGWIGVITFLIFTVFLAVSSYIGLKHVKQMTAAQRLAVVKLERAAVRLDEELQKDA